MSNIISAADYKKAVHAFGTAYQKVKDSQELDKIATAAYILSVVSDLSFTEMAEYILLTQDFLSGEVTRVGDETYDEIPKNIRQKIRLDFFSFFTKNGLKVTIDDLTFTSTIGRTWVRIQAEIIDEIEKAYTIHIGCYYGDYECNDLEDALDFLRGLIA